MGSREASVPALALFSSQIHTTQMQFFFFFLLFMEFHFAVHARVGRVDDHERAIQFVEVVKDERLTRLDRDMMVDLLLDKGRVILNMPPRLSSPCDADISQTRSCFTYGGTSGTIRAGSPRDVWRISTCTASSRRSASTNFRHRLRSTAPLTPKSRCRSLVLSSLWIID